MSARDEAAGGVDTLCECLTCGRMHRYLARPPWALSHEDLCRLSRVFGERANLAINTPDYRINEWLKLQIAKATNPSSSSPRDQACSAMLGSASPRDAINRELLEALHEGRRAIGDHSAPGDCYATGPLTGNDYRDLVECPACSFIAMYDAVIAKAARSAGIEPLALPVEGKVRT